MMPVTTPAAPSAAALTEVWFAFPVGMALVDAGGRVLAVNPEFERVAGLKSASLVGLEESILNYLLAPRRLSLRRLPVGGSAVRAVHVLAEPSAKERFDQRMIECEESLRAPLTSVYGFAELLLTQPYDDQTRQELTATMFEQIETLANLINRHLDLSHDTGKTDDLLAGNGPPPR